MLTGLRNRRYFSEVVEDELRLLKRRYDERHSGGDPNRDAVFFLLDLDRFKTVNDLFGHAGGDLTVVKPLALSAIDGGILGQQRADDDGKAHRQEANVERNSRAVDDAAELITYVTVDAHDMLRLIGRATQEMDARRGAFLHVFRADENLFGVIRRNDRGEDRANHEQTVQNQPAHGRTLAEQATQSQSP
ncbi:MAG TPA: diguanylate cyclase [Promineifilum sp.]|nr:diguanylate cyclase [Promineifilum sp.]